MTSLREHAVALRAAARTQVGGIIAAGLGVQALNLISGPVAARMLGPAGRGAMAMVMIYSTIVTTVSTTALSRSISWSVADTGRHARDSLGRAPRIWMTWSTVPAVVAGAAAWASMSGTPERGPLAVLTAVATLFGCWMNVVVGMLQGELSIARINAMRLAYAGGYVALVTAIYILSPTGHASIVVTTNVFAMGVGTCLGWWGLRPRSTVADHPDRRRAIYGFTRRTYFTATTPLTLGLDYVVVALVLTPTELGHYSVASSVSTLPVMVLAAVGASLLPRMAAVGTHDAIRVMRRWLLAALATDVVLAVAMQLMISPAIHILFGNQFAPSIACARILMLAMAVLGFRAVVGGAAQAQHKGRTASIVDGVAAVVMVALVAGGSQAGGINGAALGFLAASVFSLVGLACVVTWRAVPSPLQRVEPEDHRYLATRPEDNQ